MAVEHADTTFSGASIPSLPSVDDRTTRALFERKERHLAAMSRIDECLPALTHAADVLTDALRSGHRVMTLGNGGSAAEAQHFAAELVGRFRRERRAYPVVALTTDSSILTAIANDYSFDSVFSRQVEAYAGENDVLVAFSTSGESENVVQAALAARRQQALTVAMTGEKASRLGRCADVVVQVPSDDTPTIQELHSVFTHVLCDLVETALMGVDGRSVA